MMYPTYSSKVVYIFLSLVEEDDLHLTHSIAINLLFTVKNLRAKYLWNQIFSFNIE